MNAHPASRTTPRRSRAAPLTLILLALVVAPAGAAAAQAGGPADLSGAADPLGSLSGLVLDAQSGEAVPGAIVTVEPAAALSVDPRQPRPALARTAVTAAGGRYRFPGLPAGQYRLRVERLGYRAVILIVDLRRPADATLSIGLELDPVVLEPVEATTRAASLFQRAANAAAELDEARIGSERARQDLFLAPDTRVVTYADVMDGVTLGEGDVFRALQRLPGVGTRDDYTAELWTRGAPWTHTRVTFDGVPLFNPVHAVGILSAITPEVLGAVFFHPGVRPAGIGEGVAGVVDLRTRPGGGEGAIHGTADLSLASAKLALEQHREGRGGWVIAARRSHLGVLADGLGRVGVDSLDLPYLFHDVAGRVDVELGGGARIEASGLREEDRLEGDVAGVLERTRASWGNTAGRATLHLPVGDLAMRQTLGGSWFAARTNEHLVRAPRSATAWTEPASRNEIEFLEVAGELSPTGVAYAAAPWAVGYAVARSRGSYDGPAPRYHAAKPDTTAQFLYAPELLVAAVWGEARIEVGERLAVSPGLRLEAGNPVVRGPRVRPGPRLAVRLALSGTHSLSLGAGRSWQYSQAIGLAGPSIHPAFHASHFWIWSGDRAPAIRADVASLGTERWLGRGWLGSTTVWARRATGVALPDPTPGRLGRRPIFVIGENEAWGIDTSLRRLGARWSASLGHAYGVSRVEAAGRRYPSPADRRHILDAMVGARLMPSVRVAAAFTAMSGAPFTRAYTNAPQDCATFGFGCGNPNASFVQEPNAERTPVYRSLDVSLHWGRRIGRVEAGGYLQVRNLAGRDNASTYAGTIPIGRIVTREGTEIDWDDRLERGLPRLPLVGARLAF